MTTNIVDEAREYLKDVRGVQPSAHDLCVALVEAVDARDRIFYKMQKMYDLVRTVYDLARTVGREMDAAIAKPQRCSDEGPRSRR